MLFKVKIEFLTFKDSHKISYLCLTWTSVDASPLPVHQTPYECIHSQMCMTPADHTHLKARVLRFRTKPDKKCILKSVSALKMRKDGYLLT